MTNIKKVNIIYGPNGSGKSSIARSLGVNSNERCHVYDRNYVEATFAQDSDIPGVFSLGEKSSALDRQITEAKENLSTLSLEVNTGQQSLDEANKRYQQNRTSLKEVVWKRKDTLPHIIVDSTTGLKGNKEKLLTKLLGMPGKPPEDMPAIESLEKTAATLFSDNPQPIKEIEKEITDFSLDHELLEMLTLPVSPLKKNRLSALIEKFDSLPWVEKGKLLLDEQLDPNNICPFCQQEIPDHVTSELNDIISTDYKNQIAQVDAACNQLLQSIETAATKLLQHKENLELLGATSKYASIKGLLTSMKLDIKEAFKKKLEKPEGIVNFDHIGSSIERLVAEAKSANKAVEDHNNLLKERKESIAKFNKDTFTYLRYTLCSDAIKVGISQIKTDEQEVSDAKAELERLKADQEKGKTKLFQLQEQTTSTEATVVKINSLLRSAGFNNFHLRSYGSSKEKFKIVRNDESTAPFKTLSEGEKTSITLFYFLQEIQAPTQSGKKNPNIAVIDDPISSLDDGTLFFMSRILRDLIRTVDEGKHPNIEQLFIFTHNLRFHKEVCYKFGATLNHYKIDNTSSSKSTIKHSGKRNPVKTPYEELWAGLCLAMQEPDHECIWLGNVVRRIVESYYEFLGLSENLYEVDESVSIEDRMLHEAVVAWSHGHSHKIYEQDAALFPNSTPQGWMDALRNLFERTGNLAHFNAMTGSYLEKNADPR